VSPALDRAGVVVSLVCAMHCGLLPIAATMLPLVTAQAPLLERLETPLLLTSAAIAAASIGRARRHYGRWGPWMFVVAGFALIAIARLVFEEPVWMETFPVVSGALLIATAHVLNWRGCSTEPRRGRMP
jgi:hypothetical protein